MLCTTINRWKLFCRLGKQQIKLRTYVQCGKSHGLDVFDRAPRSRASTFEWVFPRWQVEMFCLKFQLIQFVVSIREFNIYLDFFAFCWEKHREKAADPIFDPYKTTSIMMSGNGHVNCARLITSNSHRQPARKKRRTENTKPFIHRSTSALSMCYFSFSFTPNRTALTRWKSIKCGLIGW